MSQTVPQVEVPREKITMQCRSISGDVIESVNDVDDITEAIGIKLRWQKQYNISAYMISIHFIYK